MARCCCNGAGATGLSEAGITCQEVPSCFQIEADSTLSTNPITFKGTGTLSDPRVVSLDCAAVAECVADGTTITVQDGKLTSQAGTPSCKEVVGCVEQALAAPLITVDGLIGIDQTAIATSLADGTTITATGGKLSATASAPFSCDDLEACFDLNSVMRRADGKYQVNCAWLHENCNVQPLTVADASSGLTLTQPADPVTDPATISVNGQVFVQQQVLPNLAELLSPCAAGVTSCVPNPLVLDADGKLTTTIATPGITGVQHSDTTTITLNGDGATTPLAATLNVSTAPDNRLEVDIHGAYVPPISIADTSTIDMSGKGSVTSPLQAAVKVSENPGNTIQVDGDGLYVPAPVSVSGRRFVIERKNYAQTENPDFFSWAGSTPETDTGYSWDSAETVTVTDTGIYLIEAHVKREPIQLGANNEVRIVINSDTTETNGTSTGVVVVDAWQAQTTRLGRLQAGDTVRVKLVSSAVGTTTWACRLAIARIA